MLKDPLYKLVFKLTAALLAVIALCRVNSGIGIACVAAVGIYYALCGNAGVSLLVYTAIPALAMVNPVIMPRGSAFSMISRLAALALAGALVIGGEKRQGNEKLPVGYLFVYLLVALVSSVQGYFPLISYFKIVNFAAFFTGLYIGTKNIDQRPESLLFIRAGFLAFGIFFIWGSLATLPFPAVAYLTSARGMITLEGLQGANEALKGAEYAGLFTGASGHSQFLGPCLACLFGWIACDMLFVERRLRLLHLLLLAPIPVMLTMTRSRIGMLTFCLLLAVLMFYCLPRIQLPQKERKRIQFLISAFAVLIVAAATIGEIRNGKVSSLLRKTTNLEDDERTLSAAFTGSRMGLIQQCLKDFSVNPMLGTGFQVIQEHRARYEAGEISIFSASIEKGLLPLMVLGETGIIGTGAFVLFLGTFFVTAARKGYYAALTMFCSLLATNMAEATFFSPAGCGGLFWMLTVVGGYVIDMGIKSSRTLAYYERERNIHSPIETSS